MSNSWIYDLFSQLLIDCCCSGFGGPLAGLSGGAGVRSDDPWSVTPLHSRPGSPHHNPYGASFDFGQ